MTAESSLKPARPLILTIYGGSSSIKFALYQEDGPLKRPQVGSGFPPRLVRREH
jgi:acetate kinase